MNTKLLKEKARKNLKGNYSVMVAIVLTFLLINLVCNIIGALINAKFIAPLLVMIISSLLFMGAVHVTMQVAKGEKPETKEFFSQTDLMFKYLGVTIVLAIMNGILGIFEFLAFKSTIIMITCFSEIDALLAGFLITVGIVLTVAVIIANIYLAIAFSQSYFILYEEPKLKVRKVLSKSFDMTAYYTMEYFTLVLSFIGWFILGIFTFGLLYLWLIPYISVTLANFYIELKKDYEEYSGEETEDLFKDTKEDLEEIPELLMDELKNDKK